MYLNKQTLEQNMSVTTEQKNLHLLPHNREAYEKVMAHFENHQRAAIVHATGTGKSYCIAAIASHFSKVLVMAPNNFVLNETQKVCNEGVEFRTYASSIYDEVPSTGYDLIVLDEFHRAGAPEWGHGVKKIIAANPIAKILGTSATHIRYLDHERDMAEELFDGNIVSYLSLGLALKKNILPTPIYVSSLYSADETIEKAKGAIRTSKYMEDGEKKTFLHRLAGISRSWSESHGVSPIIKKYFSSDIKRIIVFCSKVAKAAKARQLLGDWLSSAGFKRIRFYQIDYQEKYLSKEMEDFELDNYDGLKVAISVNMLNEGIHVPHVDGIIMLRSTISRIIIEQQIGRCLTAENILKRPVVLDLVNNMDTMLLDYCKTYSFGGGSNGNNESSSNDELEPFPFEVIDECRDFREFYEEICKFDDVAELKDDIWYDHFLPLLTEFYDKNGRLPYPSEDLKAVRFIEKQRFPMNQRKYPHRMNWLVAHGYSKEPVKRTGLDERLDILEEAIKKNNGKLPTQKEDSYVNGIYQEFQKFLKGKKKNKSLTQAHLDRFQRILQMYVTPMKAVQVRFEKIKKRVEQEGIIQRGSGIASDLDYIWIRNHMNRLEISEGMKAELRKMIGLEDNEPICKGNEALKKFVIERGFLPTPKDKPYYGILMKFHKRGGAAIRNDPETYAFLLDHGFAPYEEK